MWFTIEGQMLELRVAVQCSLPAQQWMCNGTLLNDARTTRRLPWQANVWYCRTDLATSSNQWVSFSIHIFIQLNMSVHVKFKVVQRGPRRPLHVSLLAKAWAASFGFYLQTLGVSEPECVFASTPCVERVPVPPHQKAPKVSSFCLIIPRINENWSEHTKKKKTSSAVCLL